MSESGDDSGDTCRICAGPAEPNQPLFHPCKCSGTIRYIHQDCLTTWLAHSKKKTCDVCKAEYAFEKGKRLLPSSSLHRSYSDPHGLPKLAFPQLFFAQLHGYAVYDPQMPDRLPPVLFLRRLAVQLFQWQLFGMRALFVSTVWLALLPYLTIQVWRLYFWVGEGLAWATFDEPWPRRTVPRSPPPAPTNATSSTNSTSSPSSFDINLTLFGNHIQLSEVLANVSYDIFAGQIIAALIIIVFLALFLLREWIVQNARPGVFGDPLGIDGLPAEEGDDDVPPHEPAGAVPPGAIVAIDGELVIPNPLPIQQELDAEAEARPEPEDDQDVPVVPPAFIINHPPHASAAPTPPLPFPLVESRPSSSQAVHGHSSTIESPIPTPYRPPSPSSPPSSTEREMDEATEREYIRRQREHYFRLVSPESMASPSPFRASPIPSTSSNNEDGAQQTQSPGAGPSTRAPGTEPPLIALPPSPPLSDSSSARAAPASSSAPKRRRLAPRLGGAGSGRRRAPISSSQVGTLPFESNFEGNGGVAQQSDLANWVATNPNFTLNIPPGWSLSSSSPGGPASTAPSASASNSGSESRPELQLPLTAVTSDSSRPTSFSSDDAGTSTAGGSEAVSSPTTAIEPDTPPAHDTPELSAAAAFAPSLPQLRSWPDRAQSQSPPLRKEFTAFSPPNFSSTQASASSSTTSFHPITPVTSIASSSAAPRRPPLPPTTPNDELPPPSPRPTHARPSPLPKAGFPSSVLAEPSQPAPSPLHQLAASSSTQDTRISPPLGATYRAPEDLTRPSTSYFPPPAFDEYEEHETLFKMDDEEEETDVDVSDDQDDDSEEEVEAGHRPEGGVFAELGPNLRQQLEEAMQRLEHDDLDDADPPPALRDDVGLPPLEPAQARQDDNGDDGMDQGDPAEGAEEDLDGLLEAVGLRGPFISLIQNVFLMVFILTVTIALAIFVPYTLGKSVALNALKPKRLLFLLHLPIKLVRLITDPVVDGIVWFIRPAFSHLYRIFLEVWKLKVPGMATKSNIQLDGLYMNSLRRLQQFTPSVFRFSRKTTTPTEALPTKAFFSAYRDVAKGYLSKWLARTPSNSDVLVSSNVTSTTDSLRPLLTTLASNWRELAVENGPREQVFAIWFGYYLIITSALLFLRSGIMLNGATRIVRNIVTQQLIVLKVAFFILIELMVFPFGCGVVLDLSTLPLFPGATLKTRWMYASQAPVAATFFRWMIGTMFMYQFAMVLSVARAHMRKGALWFVKDPQDPSFHPIRDILDRPTLGQLRKLGMSAFMYAIVIAGGIGTAVYTLRYIWTPYKDLIPLRWDSRHPLSEVPVDLLFLHLVFPVILDAIDPRELFSPILHAWWDHAAHEFRLSSFLFGERVDEEEVGTQYSWRRLPLIRDLAVLQRENEPAIPDDGHFARVPASDTVALPDQPRQMVVPTNEAGAPMDDRGVELIEAQNEAARKAHRDPNEDYQVVYLPPHFARRVMAFVVYLWATGASMIVMALGTPILIGRRILDLFPKVPAHDGYSFLLGVTVAWMTFVVANFISNSLRDIQLETNEIRAREVDGAGRGGRFGLFVDLYVGGTWRIVSWAVKMLGMWAMIAVVLPLLIALVLELYILLPLRMGFQGAESVVTLHIWEDWALGCVLATIMVRMAPVQNRAPLFDAWDEVINTAPGDVDVGKAFTDLILPLLTGLIIMLAVPGLVPAILIKILPFPAFAFPIRHVYPSLFIAACVALGIDQLRDALVKWAQSVRDSEYLVALRLQNMEDRNSKAAKRAEAAEAS